MVKQILAFHQKGPPLRKYTRVTDEEWQQVLQCLVFEGKTIAETARITGVKYENAKRIFRVYRNEGRHHKTPDNLKRLAPKLRSKPQGLQEQFLSKNFGELLRPWNEIWNGTKKPQQISAEADLRTLVDHPSTQTDRIKDAFAKITTSNAIPLVQADPTGKADHELDWATAQVGNSFYLMVPIPKIPTDTNTMFGPGVTESPGSENGSLIASIFRPAKLAQSQIRAEVLAFENQLLQNSLRRV